jgi:hypothetical protein
MSDGAVDPAKAAVTLNMLRALGSASISYEGADGLQHGAVDAFDVWRSLPEAYRAYVGEVIWLTLVKGQAPQKLTAKNDRFVRNAGQVIHVILSNLNMAIFNGQERVAMPGDPANLVDPEEQEHRDGVTDYLRLKVRYEGTVEALVEYTVHRLQLGYSLPPERECFISRSNADYATLIEYAVMVLEKNLLTGTFRESGRGKQKGYYVTLKRIDP